MDLKTFTSAAIGVYTLRRNPLRTILSILGVIIGVASLVAILMVTDGLEAFSREQIEKTTDLQTIIIKPKTVVRTDGIIVNKEDPVVLSNAVRDSLALELGDRATVTMVLETSEWVKQARDTAAHGALVAATLPTSEALLPVPVEAGRFLRAEDSGTDPNVAVLSHALAAKIVGRTNTSSAVGLAITFGGETYEVIGVVGGGDSDDVPRVFIPLTPVRIQKAFTERRIVPSLVVKAARVEEVAEIRSAIERWLGLRFGKLDDNFTIMTSSQRIAQVSQAMFVFKLAMGFITGISLLVGGIGIMNVLLASVSERTREIGIRRAAGARARDILVQFLAESVAISAAGSLLGVVLGIAATAAMIEVIRRVTDAPLTMILTWNPILVAVAAAFMVGLTFGVYPARKASKLSPTDAIRYE